MGGLLKEGTSLKKKDLGVPGSEKEAQCIYMNCENGNRGLFRVEEQGGVVEGIVKEKRGESNADRKPASDCLLRGGNSPEMGRARS